MMDRLAHRGPDGKGIRRQKDRGVLGHCRLAIMDPEHGQHPLEDESGSTFLVGNGEIYNWKDLRETLVDRHTFRSRNDNEVALHLFEDVGVELTRRLDGMFALAIASGQRLFLARDPIGIKPLYYGWRSEGEHECLLFASEMKALAGLVDHLAELPPGSYYESGTGIRKYYSVPEHDPRRIDATPSMQELRRTLEEAIVKRLMSDVPLGAFLSGGVDSSIIAAVARRGLGELHTFAVGMEGSGDLEAARRVARHIDSIHHEYMFSRQEIENDLREIIYHLESFDQDLVRSAIPCYYCSRLAADRVKVILTGEGADELFAGYRYYRNFADPAALHGELRRSVSTLHNVNLQRVDRMTMAHGIEGRVPFLDTEVIDLGLRIPAGEKLAVTHSGKLTEKVILRRTFEDLLPSEIVWREKEQFDQGSGTTAMIPELLRSLAAGLDPRAYQLDHPGIPLRSREECYYHKLFMEVFERPRSMLSSVGRWRGQASEYHRPTGNESGAGLRLPR
jgi:asparagine synthase (glutamine-hydrolysing)